MSEQIPTCKCGLQIQTQDKCHCVISNSTIIANKRTVIAKKCERQYCCFCAEHPMIKNAIKAAKKGKNFDEKELILFLIKQFDWYMIWQYKQFDPLVVTTANATDEIVDDKKIYCERCLFRTLESNLALKFKKDNEELNFALTICGRHN